MTTRISGLLLIAGISMSACGDSMFVANMFHPIEFHTKIPLQENLISGRDTLYMLEPIAVVKKRGFENRQGYMAYWKNHSTDAAKIMIDPLESKTLAKDVDSLNREKLKAKNIVLSVKFDSAQSIAILSEYDRMIDHFRGETIGEVYDPDRPIIEPVFKFSDRIHLNRHRRYGIVYIKWQHDDPKWVSYCPRTPAWIEPEGFSTSVVFNFCIVDGYTNNVVFFNYSRETYGYNTGPTFECRFGWSYKEFLQRQINRMARHYHPVHS